MFSSKPHAERHSETGDAFQPDLGDQRWAEPRSFAASEPERAEEVEGQWAPAWAWTAPDLPTQIPATATNVVPLLHRERRALIVIPCLNEAGLIGQVIERILDDDGLVDPLLIVADGGSKDGSREIVAEIAAHDPRVLLMHNPGRFQSAGLNLAAEAMGEDRPWLVRVDAHADYPENYVSTLIAEARRTGATAVVVGMDTRGRRFFQRAVAAAQNSLLGSGGAAHRSRSRAGWVDHGHHALVRLETFEALAGYDASFSHNEDAEFDLRLTREGGRIWLTDKVRIIYHPRSTPGALWRQYFSYGKGRARTVLKHYTPLKVRQALPLAVAPAVLSLLAAPFFWPFAVPALTWMGTSLAYGLLLGVRKRDPAAGLSGVAAMIMHLAWSAGFWMQLFYNRPPPETLEEHEPVLRPVTAP